MNSIFLSASVPIKGRGDYFDTADPFLIQCAVREFFMSVIREHVVVWGGHPAITPMVWSICADLKVDYKHSVVLYQSKYFEDRYPDENAKFQNVKLVDAVPNDMKASLLKMRETMLSRHDLWAAVFIGGMEGVEVEYDMFRSFHPGAKTVLVPSTGGAARKLALKRGENSNQSLQDINFSQLFHSALGK